MQTGIYQVKFRNHPVRTTLVAGRLMINVPDVDRFLALDNLGLLKDSNRIGAVNTQKIAHKDYVTVPALLVILFDELNHKDILTSGYSQIIKAVCRWLVSPAFDREIMEYVSGWAMVQNFPTRPKLLRYQLENQEVGELDGVVSDFSDQVDHYNLPTKLYRRRSLEQVLGIHLSAIEKFKMSWLNLAYQNKLRAPFYWEQLRIRQLPKMVIHGKNRVLKNGFWMYNHQLLVVYQQFLKI